MFVFRETRSCTTFIRRKWQSGCIVNSGKFFIGDRNPRIYQTPNCVQTFATEAYNVELLLRVGMHYERDGRQ